MMKERSFREFILKYSKIAVLLYIVFIVLYFPFIYIIEKEQEQKKQELSMLSCASYLESVLNNVSSINYVLFGDESITKILHSPLTVDRYAYVKAMTTLNQQVSTAEHVSEIYIYHDRAGIVLVSNQGKYEMDNFHDREYLESLDLMAASSIISRVSNSKPTITLTARWAMSSFGIKRYTCINLDAQKLEKRISELLDDAYYLQLTAAGSTFFTYNPKDSSLNANESFISTKALGQFNVSISVMREKQEFYYKFLVSYIRESLLFLSFAALLSLVFLFLLRSLSKTFRPMIFQLASLYREEESQLGYTLNEMKRNFDHLITDRQVLFDRVDETKWLLEEKILTDLLRGVIINSDELQKFCSSIGFISKGYHHDCYLVACISVFGKEYALATEDNLFPKVLIKNILINGNKEDFLMHVVVESEENIGVLLNYPSSLSRQEVEWLMEKKIIKINESFNENPNIEFFVSIVNPVSSVEKICSAYSRAKANMIYRYVFLNKNYVIDTLKNEESSVLLSYVDVQMIKSAINADKFDVVHRYMKNLVEEYLHNPIPESFYGLKFKALMSACVILDQAYLPNNLEKQKRLFDNLEQLFQSQDEKNIIINFIRLTNDISNQRISLIPEGELGSGYLQQVFSFIESHYDKELSISDIATHLNLNPKYLARLFKKETGQTMTQYISELRMKKALSLLNRTDLSIQDIGEQIGLYDCRNFIRLFKKTFDITPGEYKAQRKYLL